MKEAFTTKHLNVFQCTLKPNRHCVERLFFVGFMKDEDQPAHVVTATVMPEFIEGSAYLDWIETHPLFRRQGLATEMFVGIYAFIGRPIATDGATLEGEHFCDSIERLLESPNAETRGGE